MIAIKTPTDENPTKTVLFVISERTTAERYAGWLAPQYPTELTTDWRAALDVLGDKTAVVVFSCDLQNIAPLEFVDHVQTTGYNGKIVLIINPQSELDITEVHFDSVLSKPVSKETLIETVEKSMLQVRYETRLEQHLSLAKRKAQWDVKMSDEELKTDNRYANLIVELNRLDTELDKLLGHFEPDDFPALFQGVLS